jgi:hypothetical protein
MLNLSSLSKVLSVKSKDLIYSLVHSIRTSFLLYLVRRKLKAKTLMSLDLHTSVSRDTIAPLSSYGISLDRWTISASSHLFGEPNLRTAQIRGDNWRTIDKSMIKRFLKRYRLALSRYSGFLVSYTFSFLQIFESLNKPILAVNATRYESPYTLKKEQYLSLNESIQRLNRSGHLTIVSNNLGDKDYLKLLTGVDSSFVPNLCDYVTTHKPDGLPWIVHSRNRTLSNQIASQITNAVTQEFAFPLGFTHEAFSKHAGVILIPYNISTMRLFELTTAGFPVRIPSDRLLKEWASLPGVLSELSWTQVFNVDCPEWLLESPADPKWEGFLDWWLERADWNDSFYFPNVTRFDSIEELKYPPAEFSLLDIELRNKQIKKMWDEVVSVFAKKLI